jgi:hypothetical protein
MKSSDPKAKQRPSRRPKKGDPDELNQATTREFEREGLGVAPKE